MFTKKAIYTKRNGYSLIEVLATTAIIAAVSVFIALSLANFRNNAQVVSESQNIASVLALARSNTVGGKDNILWGVHLATNDFTLFQGGVYDPADPNNVVYTLPIGVTISSIVLAGGGSDVIFNRINGGTSQAGSLTVSAQSNVIVTINSSGEISVGGTLPAPGGTRIIDTRHVDFTLNWSIQNSITLTLTFYDPPNPATVQNIAMAPYFSMGNTIFNWSGQYTIGGGAQVLKIHTHLIDTPGNKTILSVHRDKMENSKALDIAIDGVLVASYNASGDITPWPGVTFDVQ
ncbi:MAG: hypothetical protein A3A80_02605 [Candidatus Terrybacteria bacterium RIFCSPLOWO2_01_FULL_44_24]|uniref:Prepilin-type N-terminal cleavage/methylation domain-containing protein n=1 Tax=Candidatus Terrybacteria bacterium RIFCSPHIGHO2_01_FULL_43_35 TaxID=1802361 RepID=A0A1G2PEG2_9BACT|nr:MAG: hypothetical protein A2828_02400 [Candidatus Terrybacteria bacterium RIFCSPHIGHO2_01_FULL_43_35]OHA50284.1 MAG: hypothetical protein A3B75_00595 [Candidatus Terrybacteria bacterium RIFCSPHIGHO2_02_FULL_43_14]OHA50963.1 MAG: hypothetical protein A3A80_02605 [Candidatus Terrybacteria bacterium RIFCSPLOWO2_01_FULL_44_24]HLF67294.1 prepilin-type N-terminal cleavage/methylation domain-containing protein [Gammaproteobacteria bacterium]